MFRIENDLVFNGSMTVKGEDECLLDNNSIVRGGECINWTGLLPIYEDSDNIIVPPGECNVTVWDSSDNFWLGESIYNYTKLSNNIFHTFSTSANRTNQDGELYTINLTGIPKECDKTNRTFTLRIDNDNVTFSHLRPDQNEWQKSSEVFIGVSITDHGGGLVDNESILHKVSTDNGNSWSNWTKTVSVGYEKNLDVFDFVNFEDGDNNYIKWSALDSLGNGPAESVPFRVLVDTQPVYFTDPSPEDNSSYNLENVSVGITISDNTSGVNASLIKYSTSIDNGTTWSKWYSIDGYSNNISLNIKMNLSFSNITGNRIRWRAYDVAGNGPTYSEEYKIIVNPKEIKTIPKIKLLSPENNSMINSNKIILTWELITKLHTDILYDIKLDTQSPPEELLEENYSGMNINISDLKNSKTYYWTVIPKVNNLTGKCISGIWSFIVEFDIPKVELKSPVNNSNITSILPTLVWAVKYSGFKTLSYHVYLDTSPDFLHGYYESSNTHFIPEFNLEQGETYYWKIVPWADDIKGIESPIWSFTVEYSDQPMFNLKLILEPNELDLRPGEMKFVKAVVTNLGNLNDSIKLSINFTLESEVSGSIYGYDSKLLAPIEQEDFLVRFSTSKDAGKGKEIIYITAKSENAEDNGLVIEKKAQLIVNILGASGSDSGTMRDEWINWIWLMIILFVILLSILLLILLRKKRETEDNSKVHEEKELGTPTNIDVNTDKKLDSIEEALQSDMLPHEVGHEDIIENIEE
jgi:hypothetical protein